MGIKIFWIIILTIILFPFFVTKKTHQEIKKISLPYFTIENGIFQTYNNTLQKAGKFIKLDYYSKNHYVFIKLNANDYNNSTKLISDKMVFKNNTYIGKNIIIKKELND